MDSKAQYADRIEQLEHTNVKLENETETIGEYIQLYQAQRFALKKKFEDKDHVIKQLTDEHARMQVSDQGGLSSEANSRLSGELLLVLVFLFNTAGE